MFFLRKSLKKADFTENNQTSALNKKQKARKHSVYRLFKGF